MGGETTLLFRRFASEYGLARGEAELRGEALPSGAGERGDAKLCHFSESTGTTLSLWASAAAMVVMWASIFASSTTRHIFSCIGQVRIV